MDQPTSPDQHPSHVPMTDTTSLPQLQPDLPPPAPDLTEQGLWYLGLALVSVLLLAQGIDLMGYPTWARWFHHLLLLVEAGLPLGVSFFLKDPKRATLLRGMGILVLLLYIVTLF